MTRLEQIIVFHEEVAATAADESVAVMHAAAAIQLREVYNNAVRIAELLRALANRQAAKGAPVR